MHKLKSGFMFIELLLVLAIVIFILFKIFNFYFKKSPLDRDNQKFMTGQSIDTTSSKSIVDSTKNKLEDIQKQHLNELDNVK